MMVKNVPLLMAFTLVVSGDAIAQHNGRPASDILLQLDIWGNPTSRGGVTNNGPNAHSVW